MAALSITTVVLSLVDGCPGLPFFVLEIIVNSAMIAEVAIRMIALSKVILHPTRSLLAPHSNVYLLGFLEVRL